MEGPRREAGTPSQHRDKSFTFAKKKTKLDWMHMATEKKFGDAC
jgi:hypothetical protein